MTIVAQFVFMAMLAAPLQTPPAKGGTAPPASMTAVHSAIERGDFEQARKLLRTGAAGAKKADAPKWLVLEAELEITAKRYDIGGLAAMKVVALHGKGDQVAYALFWTARAYEGLGRPAKALQLYDECIRHKRAVPSLREEARKRTAALRKKTPEQ